VAAFPALGYDPAPGSAEAIRALAADCRHVAGQLTGEAHTLTGLGSTSWTGPAALAFAGQLDTLPDDLRTAAHSFTLTAQAIDRYAAELADSQLAARRAEAAAHAAQHEQRIARAALDAAADPASAEPARRRLAAADQDLAAARRHAQRARDQARSAARRAAAAVRDASRWAPRKPHESVFERLGGAIADGWTAVTDNVHHWVVEHAEVLRQISEVLSTVSAISGTLALAICWVPVVGQAAAGALGTIAAVTGGAATATNALLAANGQGSWTHVAVDLGLTALGGAGKAAGKLIAARRVTKAAGKLSGGAQDLRSMDRASRRALLEQKWEDNAGRQLRRMEAENSGAHFVENHGAQTTLEQQWERAAKGTLPNGQTHTPRGLPYDPRDASRFFSNRIQLQAMRQAEKFHQLTGKDSIVVMMPDMVGEGFLKDSLEMVRTSNVKVYYRRGKPYTGYPLITDVPAVAFEGVR
jgi:hypothetical protein